MTQYIDKSAVVAEVERRISEVEQIDKASYEVGLLDAYKIIRSFLNTLEVKDDVVAIHPISKDLEEAAENYPSAIRIISPQWEAEVESAFIACAKWQKGNLWKNAQGNDLPEIDREVIVLSQPYPCEGNEYVVSYAHRPSEYWMGKNICTGEITRYEPKRYDKGGWNQPNVKWWLDLDLPKMQE